MERKTPLFDCHRAAGGKLVPFAGYILPVQYTGVIAEHMAVRTKAGLFDVSHMGEVMITGPDALKNINRLYTNDFTNMADGRVRYSPMCNDSGGVVDDLIVYRFSEQEYFVVINAANHDKDVAWMKAHLLGDVTFKDISDDTAQLALQGPNSRKILLKLADESQIPVKYYTFTKEMTIAEVRCLVSRTGYTGELGYELYCRPEDAPGLWEALLKAGEEEGLIPCGLGARDTLRLEAAMPLYGHEMDESITPLEAGLSFAVKMQKDDFIGKSGILNSLPQKRERVGILVTGRGIAREGCPVFYEGRQIGITTSGTHLPYLGYPAAMAIVTAGVVKPGEVVEVEVRGRRIAGEVTALPFYKNT